MNGHGEAIDLVGLSGLTGVGYRFVCVCCSVRVSVSASGVGACAGMGLAFYSDMVVLSLFLLGVGMYDCYLLVACCKPLDAPSRGVTPFALTALTSVLRSRFWWIRAAEVEGVEPMASAVAAVLPLREDVVTDGGDSAKVLSNAPKSADGFFIVPKVVE